jgi:GNAT superfamily N-acetyltransferase
MQFEFLRKQDLSPDVHRDIEAFLDSQSNSHPYQFPTWMWEADPSRLESPYCALLREGGQLRWFALCGVNYPATRWLPAIRSLLVYRGPACDEPEVILLGLRRLVMEGRKRGFAFLDITPDWLEGNERTIAATLSAEGWLAQPEGRSSLRLALLPEEDELLASFRKTTRYEIRRSEREGVVVRFAKDDDDIREFQRIYFAMAQERSFPPDEAGHLWQVLRWLVKLKDRGGLLLAFIGSDLVGGILIVKAATRCWYILGATTKHDRVSAGHLLQWHAIRWAKERGCTEYDFGGYRERARPGPFLFKRGFCQNIVHFSSGYMYPLDRRLCSVVDLVAKTRSRISRAALFRRGNKTHPISSLEQAK